MDCLHGTGLATFQNSTLCRVVGVGGRGRGEEGNSVRVTTNCISYSKKKTVETLYQFFMVFLVLYIPMICLKKKKHKLELTIFRRFRCGSLQNMKSEPG